MPGQGQDYRSHDWCEPGFFALRLDDEDARDLLWFYARRIHGRDSRTAEDIHEALRAHGYDPINRLPRRG